MATTEARDRVLAAYRGLSPGVACELARLRMTIMLPDGAAPLQPEEEALGRVGHARSVTVHEWQQAMRVMARLNRPQ